MSNLTQRTFKADIIDTKSITLNGVSLSNYSIMTETDSREVQNISGDLQFRITPDMFDENGNFIIKNLPDGSNFKYAKMNIHSSLRDPNVSFDGVYPTISSMELDGNTLFLPDLYGGKNVISAIKEIDGIVYYKKIGDENIYMDDGSGDAQVVVTGIEFKGTDIVNTHFFNTTDSRYIRIPYNQFNYLGTNFTFEIKLKIINTGGCNIHFSYNGENTYNLWSGWTELGQWHTHKWIVVNGVVTYFVDGVRRTSMFSTMNLSSINRDLLIGADWDGTDINDTSDVWIDYVAFWNGSGNLVNYYNFQDDEFGSYLKNKGSNTASATHNGSKNVSYTSDINTTLQTSKTSLIEYNIINVDSQEIVINIKDNIFEEMTIDLWA